MTFSAEDARIIEIARDGIARATAICRSVQARIADVGALTKSDDSPVTVADFASQAVVVRALLDGLGPLAIVGEESAAELRQAREDGRHSLVASVVEAARIGWPDADADAVFDAIDLGHHPAGDSLPNEFWTLDPIDGTKGFLRGQHYAICLAQIRDGRPRVGLMSCPNLSPDASISPSELVSSGALFVAVDGHGAFVTDASDPSAPLVPLAKRTATAGPIRRCESVESGHTSRDDAERVIAGMGEAGEIVRLDGQGKYAVVGRGQADIYLRLPRKKSNYSEKIWDHASGTVLAQECGCTVSDLRGAPLDFNQGSELSNNRGVVVCPNDLHGAAIAAIAQAGVE